MKEFTAFKCMCCKNLKPNRGKSIPVILEVAWDMRQDEPVPEKAMFCVDCANRLQGNQ